MKRYDIPAAPDGCGTADDGACFGCVVHKMRRSLHQLLPLRYETTYHTGDGRFVNFDAWRMWFGRVFAHRHTCEEII